MGRNGSLNAQAARSSGRRDWHAFERAEAKPRLERYGLDRPEEAPLRSPARSITEHAMATAGRKRTFYA